MRNDLLKTNLICRKTFEFAKQILDFAELLENNRKYVISQQLMRSGISIGANVMEAQNAESRKDFLHKMKIAAKEADEAQYWLLLCCDRWQFCDPAPLLAELEIINSILNKILVNTRK